MGAESPVLVLATADCYSRQTWGAEIKENPPTVKYAEVMNSEGGMAKMTDLIVSIWFAFQFYIWSLKGLLS